MLLIQKPSETTLAALYDVSGRFSDSLQPVCDYIGKMRDAEASDEVAELLARVQRFLLGGQPDAALGLLGYAQRREVSNRAITLGIGEVKLHLGDPTCVEQFEFLAAQMETRFAGLFTAAARLRAGELDKAAAALNRAFRHYAPPLKGDVVDLADRIADRTQAQGWCVLGAGGSVVVGGVAHEQGGRDIAILLDGIAMEVGPHLVTAGEEVTEIELPRDWHRAKSITVLNRRLPLIGSPIAIAEGLRPLSTVWTEQGRILGRIWYPGQPLHAPQLSLFDHADGAHLLQISTTLRETTSDYATLQFQRECRFEPGEEFYERDSFALKDEYGTLLQGCPLRPLRDVKANRSLVRRIASAYPAASESLDASEHGVPDFSLVTELTRLPPQSAPFVAADPLVVIPVYRGLEVTLACIASVRKYSAASVEILAVVDASPDAELIRRLQALAEAGQITLILKPRNEGFPATANIGLRHAAASGRDVILLNSDTIATAGWIARLQQPLLADSSVGTVTPLSNAASIFSIPNAKTVNAIPTEQEAQEMAALAYALNGDVAVEVPTAHGFCMYIRKECLKDTGVLRQDVFGLGYGEENDFSLRASHLGWKHVAAAGAFIGHVESQSFTDSKKFLLERNLKRLNRLHPGYDQFIQDWVKKEALEPYRRRLVAGLWQKKRGDRPTVVLVTHNRDGGVQRFIDYRAKIARDAGHFVLVMRPGAGEAAVTTGYLEDHFSPQKDRMSLDLSKRADRFSELFAALGVESMELHHTIGWAPDVVREFLHAAGRYQVFVHDYSWFCPRITLTTGDNRYCGEPSVSACDACVGEHGGRIDEIITARALVERSAAILKNAEEIFVPSQDVGRRLVQRFPVMPKVAEWEKAAEKQVPLRPVQTYGGGTRRICIVGAIGQEKGFKILLDAARWVQRNRVDLEFRIVGYTCNDKALLDTGCVHITGSYQEAEVAGLIQAQNADFAFFPSVWPETWSFVLSQCWSAGLPVIAFDIGVPAERIKASGRGAILPLGLPAPKLIEAFMRFRSSPRR